LVQRLAGYESGEGTSRLKSESSVGLRCDQLRWTRRQK
jgi:hypothetical protein